MPSAGVILLNLAASSGHTDGVAPFGRVLGLTHLNYRNPSHRAEATLVKVKLRGKVCEEYLCPALWLQTVTNSSLGQALAVLTWAILVIRSNRTVLLSAPGLSGRF